MLTIALITTIFYFHPSTSNVSALFRTVSIISETNRRVAEVFVKVSDSVERGTPIFRLDSSKQQAAVDTSGRQVAEVDAQMVVARSDLAAAQAQIEQAKAAYQQAVDELETKQELNRRNSDIVARREIERLQVAVDGRRAGIDAATAAAQAVEAKISTLLPAQKASAEAALAQAQVDLDKTIIRAGITGRVEQFLLQVGDIVNPFARAAGVLIPENAGRNALIAGFGQIEAQVMRKGMVAEATCASRPWTIIPMVVTDVQDYIAAGQFRGGEQLIDLQNVVRPGTILVYLEPLFKGGLEGVTPGSSCIANAYTSNHELLQSKDIGSFKAFGLHMIDAVGLVHAMLLRIQALLLPVQTLVFTGH